jgi:SAM-dependent methyltransferase
MNFWNERYAETGFAYGTEPNDFLAAQAQRIPRGRVLCLAEGEGRNAVYLAKLGYDVTAVDQSPVGLNKAQTLAQQQGVRITTIVADLGEFEIAAAHWHGIISISAHVPPAIRTRLHHQVVSGLTPGGVLLLEAYTPRQIEMNFIGGPKQPELCMTLAALRNELAGLKLLHAQELERDVNEGKYHKGRGAVVQLIAQR